MWALGGPGSFFFFSFLFFLLKCKYRACVSEGYLDDKRGIKDSMGSFIVALFLLVKMVGDGGFIIFFCSDGNDDVSEKLDDVVYLN